MSEDPFAAQRQSMLEHQLIARGIRDRRVLAAMGKVPRHRFVSAKQRSLAYQDTPLPIGRRQTISQPYIVAYMLEALHLSGDERVLDVGTGSGYQAALLGELAAQVDSLERHTSLARRAARLLADLGYANVHVHRTDGSLGWPDGAPYDAIIVGAGAPAAPPALLGQLAPQGRMLIPAGDDDIQHLQLWRKQGERALCDELIPVAFVPLVGKQGWPR